MECAGRHRDMLLRFGVPAIPGMGSCRGVRNVLVREPDAVRRDSWHRLVLVVDGWSDDQGAGGRFKKTGANPTDRGKLGVKRSLLTEAAGIPVGIAIDGANRHDMKLVRGTLQSIFADRPEPTETLPQGLCLDKGYDFDEVREIVKEFGFTAHICARGEEAQAIKHEAGFKARRWVVERTHSWMNRFRRILVRWEKLAHTYLAMLHLVLGIITWRAAELLK